MHPDKNLKKHLDICCGTGTLCNYIKSENIQTKGIDISEDMIKIAKNKYPKINFECFDITKYNNNEKYDFITCCCDSLNHILEIEKVFENVNKLLKKNGYFIFDINDFNNIPINKKFSNKINNEEFIIYISDIVKNKVYFNLEYYKENKLKWKLTTLEYNHTINQIEKILENTDFELIFYTKKIFTFNEKNKIIDSIYYDEMKWKIIIKKK